MLEAPAGSLPHNTGYAFIEDLYNLWYLFFIVSSGIMGYGIATSLVSINTVSLIFLALGVVLQGVGLTLQWRSSQRAEDPYGKIRFHIGIVLALLATSIALFYEGYMGLQHGGLLIPAPYLIAAAFVLMVTLLVVYGVIPFCAKILRESVFKNFAQKEKDAEIEKEVEKTETHAASNAALSSQPSPSKVIAIAAHAVSFAVGAAKAVLTPTERRTQASPHASSAHSPMPLSPVSPRRPIDATASNPASPEPASNMSSPIQFPSPLKVEDFEGDLASPPHVIFHMGSTRQIKRGLAPKTLNFGVDATVKEEKAVSSLISGGAGVEEGEAEKYKKYNSELTWLNTQLFLFLNGQAVETAIELSEFPLIGDPRCVADLDQYYFGYISILHKDKMRDNQAHTMWLAQLVHADFAAIAPLGSKKSHREVIEDLCGTILNSVEKTLFSQLQIKPVIFGNKATKTLQLMDILLSESYKKLQAPEVASECMARALLNVASALTLLDQLQETNLLAILKAKKPAYEKLLAARENLELAPSQQRLQPGSGPMYHLKPPASLPAMQLS